MPFCLAHPQNEVEQDEGTQDLGEDIELPDGKIGAKKRAKLEAKAERKAQREVRYTEFLVFIQEKKLYFSSRIPKLIQDIFSQNLSSQDSSGKQLKHTCLPRFLCSVQKNH